MSDDYEVQLAEPRVEDFGDRMAGAQNLAVMGAGGDMMVSKHGDLFGSVTTAQKVPEKRDVKALMQTLRVLAETFGDDYIYTWDVKDKNSKRPDGKTTIEGPTINLANDLAREFGNNLLDIREVEGQSHWVFYGRFTDLQTGSTLTRAFRQRKNALAGGYENDRKLDMAYQMGQSKCLRNVVVNALRSYAEFMFKVAKSALVKKIMEAPKEYLDRVRKGLELFKIPLRAAEGTVGRPIAEWDPHDIAKVFSTLKAVNEGLVSAREAFPDDDAQVPDVEETEAEETPRTGEPTNPGDTVSGAEATAEASEAEPARAATKVEAPSARAGEAAAKPKAEKPKATAEAPQETKKPAAKKPAALF